MSARAGDLQQQLQDTAAALQAAEENHRDIAKRLVEAERGLTEVMASLDQLRGENEQRRAAYMQQMRLAAALGNETSALESQVAAAAAARGSAAATASPNSTARSHGLQRELDELRAAGARTDRADRTSRPSVLAAAKDQLAQLQQQHAARQERAGRACGSGTAAPPSAPPCSRNSSAARKGSAPA